MGIVKFSGYSVPQRASKVKYAAWSMRVDTDVTLTYFHLMTRKNSAP